MSKKTNINHKELLTFSNLTNLDWHFVNLEPQDEEGKNGEIIKVYDTIKDLLTPEGFVRYDADSESYSYPYLENKTGKDIELTEEEREKGLAKMRQKAGIAMEYLEKSENSEAKFLGEWEVVYGGDNYKIATDFLDDLYQLQCDEDPSLDRDNKPFASRKKVDDREESIKKLKIISTGIGIASQFIPLGIKFKFADRALERRIFDTDQIVKQIGQGGLKVIQDTTKYSIYKDLKELSAGSAEHWALTLFNYPTKLTDTGVKNEINQETKNLREKIDSDQLKTSGLYGIKEGETVEEGAIGFIKTLNLSDTGFRVAVFKKNEKEIVIAYKKSVDKKNTLNIFKKDQKDNQKLLPEEMDLLKIVYARIKHEHQDYNISFVGCDQGGDLAFLSSLLYEKDASLFYSQPTLLKDYVDFTYHDLNKKYQDNLEIYQKGLEKTIKASSLELLSCFLLSEGIIPGLVFIIGTEVIKGVFKYLDNKKTEKLYQKLSNNKFENNGAEDKKFIIDSYQEGSYQIKGYITDDFLKTEYLQFKIRTGDKVKIKLTDAIYLIYQELNDGLDFNEEASKSLVKEKDSLIFLSSKADYELKENDQGVYEIKDIIYKEINYLNMKDQHPNVAIENTESKNGIVYGRTNFVNQKGGLIVNTLKIIAHLQRQYLAGRSKCEYVYHNLLSEKKEIQISKEIPAILSNEEKHKEHQSAYKLAYSGRQTNEYTFLPYINPDSGNISAEKPELRENYIGSNDLKVIDSNNYLTFNGAFV